MLRFTAEGGTPQLSWQPVAMPDVGDSTNGKGLNLGDFNGDGLVDVFGLDDAQYTIWLNTGDSRFEAKTLARPKPFPASFDYSFKHLAVLPHNGDSRDDFVEHWEGPATVVNGARTFDRFNWALMTSNDVSSFTTETIPSLHFSLPDGKTIPGDFTLAGDLNGDGSADLFGANGFAYYGAGVHNTLLSRVTDGLGKVVDITYGGYQTDKRCSSFDSWPEKCLPRMNGVVASHKEGSIDALSNSLLVVRDYSYQFVNARMNLTGHGWLGFDRKIVSMTSGGDDAGVTVTTDYEPAARYSVSGQLTTSLKPPYLYPLAGLVNTVTVDRHVHAREALPPIQKGYYERRTQTTNTWAVEMSTLNRPFPFATSRRTVTYERPVTWIPGGGQSTPPFEVNGVAMYACDGQMTPDGFGNVVLDDEGCQLIDAIDTGAPALESTVTTTHYTPDLAECATYKGELDERCNATIADGD